MRQIAVYGGSFDPPHLGHVMVVTHLLLNEPSITDILIVPCFQQTGKNLVHFEHRLHMSKMAFGWLPRVKVSSIEHEMGGESESFRTLQRLKDQHKDGTLRFVMGSDLMESAPKWHGWDLICQIAPPLVIGRAGISSPDGPTPISPAVSSTLIRSALAARDYHAAERYIPREVCEYIRKEALYIH